MTDSKNRNWIFLGDSLTEGVGSSRVSFVTEIAERLRVRERGVHHVRMRAVNPDEFNRFLRVNFAGHWSRSETNHESALWIWNLACEGTTIASDAQWLPWIENIQPELIVVFRGSLESIVRPAALKNQEWPWWLPDSWKGYAAMDPRCYFSTTWWRRWKQTTIDTLKRRTRLRLLRHGPGVSLMERKEFLESYSALAHRLRPLCERLVLMGLLPVSSVTFPGSNEQFESLNRSLRLLASETGSEFVDWGAELKERSAELFYRDGFHPNLNGARILAEILQRNLECVPAR